MFGEEVILEKAIDYIAYRVKKGHEEKEAKKELVSHLTYLNSFYNSVVTDFSSNYSFKEQDNQFYLTEIFVPIIDIKLAQNIWHYLEFDKIFMLENKTIIDYLIDIENQRAKLDSNTFMHKHTMTSDINARAWFNGNERIQYLKLIEVANKYIQELKKQIKILDELIGKLL